MDPENFLESEVAVAVAATVAVLSPRVRGLLRRGAVYGVAGLLIAGDAVLGLGRGLTRGAQQGATSVGLMAQRTGTADEAGGAAPLEGDAAASVGAPKGSTRRRRVRAAPEAKPAEREDIAGE
jgi:hypothetical protein